MTYLRQLLAVFFLFELLPVPIDLNVFLMGLDHLVLNLVSSLLLVLLFDGAALLIQRLSLVLDTSDRFLGVTSDLLEHA